MLSSFVSSTSHSPQILDCKDNEFFYHLLASPRFNVFLLISPINVIIIKLVTSPLPSRRITKMERVESWDKHPQPLSVNLLHQALQDSSIMSSSGAVTVTLLLTMEVQTCCVITNTS